MATECDVCEKVLDCGQAIGRRQAPTVIVRLLCELRTLFESFSGGGGGPETDPLWAAWLAGPPDVSEFTNDVGYITAETDPDFNAWLAGPPDVSEFNNDAGYYNSGDNVSFGTLSATTITGTGYRESYRAISANDTLLATDDFISATNTITLSLPTAVGIQGKTYTIKNNGTGVITIDPNGAQTIDSAATYVINTTGSGIKLISNNSDWEVCGVF